MNSMHCEVIVPDKPVPVPIPREILENVYREARKTFPAECCGWLASTKDIASVSIVRPCVNAQEKGGNPAVPGRRAETAYVFSADDLLTFSRGFDADAPPRVIYHSHPNAQAYFSATDHKVATSPWGDGPAYPVQQLVVGLDAGRVIEAALFAWADEAGGFVEIAKYQGADI